ncbi:uncharacterized protein TNCV_1761281 [Trichonephila clavipes]|nr:uncharacterized protein TNCV_1761281 [Trichonephila clavipes]
MCHENESWTRSLPIILLGLRTIWRADFEATQAELLYGESIRLPCDFFEVTLFQPQSEFVQTLKATIKDFKPVPFSYHSKQKHFIFKDLKDCSHVFVRLTVFFEACNSHIMYPIKLPTDLTQFLHFSLNVKNINVSINRLKPCFYHNSSESDSESSIREDTPNKPAEIPVKKIIFASLLLPTSTIATRGGRRVRLPVHCQLDTFLLQYLTWGEYCGDILQKQYLHYGEG